MQRWQLQQAKAQFSELVKSCQRDGPQEISVRGEPAAVMLSRRDYDRMRQARRPSLLEFLRRSPLRGVALDLERSRSPLRKVAL